MKCASLQDKNWYRANGWVGRWKDGHKKRPQISFIFKNVDKYVVN